MMSGWGQLCTMAKIFYIAGLVSLMSLALMILTLMTSIGDILKLLKRCPWRM